MALVILTPCGGLLEGDELHAEIIVEDGATLELRTQAATQVHSGRSSQTWLMSLGEGASLSYIPHMLVPHAGAAHHIVMSAFMASGARLFLAEIMAPGRLHRGEMFAYDELRSDLDVWSRGKLVARERQFLRPLDSLLCARLGPYGYFGSAYAMGPGASAFDPVDMQANGSLMMGASELAMAGHFVRAVGNRGFDLEAAFADLQLCWRQAVNSRRPLAWGAPTEGVTDQSAQACARMLQSSPWVLREE